MKKIYFYILLLVCVHNLHSKFSYKSVPIHAEKVVFLTGAAGFIGSNFLEYMFDKYPHYHFLVLDALTYAGNIENIPDRIRNSSRFSFFMAQS